MVATASVVELLIEDHVRISELARQLDASEQPAATRELFVQLAQLLAAHEAAEQHVVFPAYCAALPDMEIEAFARVGEHEEINELLAEMQTLVPVGLAFAKRASALVLDLERHFEIEQEQLFPRLQAIFDTEQLVALGTAAARAMNDAPVFPTSPSRSATSRSR